jgi:hypothetical protein
MRWPVGHSGRWDGIGLIGRRRAMVPLEPLGKVLQLLQLLQVWGRG